MPNHPARLHGLDTLRALAIALVFAYHYRVFVSGENTFGWASAIGWVGVDLFFVLSGYLIAAPLIAALCRGEGFSLPHFYARRWLRTLPAFWVVLALYFCFPTEMGGKTPPPLWRFLSFTQNWDLKPGTAFSHAWSLCIEEQFYLVLPLVLLALRHCRRPVQLLWTLLLGGVLCGIGLRTALWFEHGREIDDIAGYYPNIYYATLTRVDEFLPGVAVALLQYGHPQRWQRLMASGRLLFAVSLLATLLVLTAQFHGYYIEGYGYGFWMTSLGYSLTALCFAGLVLAALSPASPLHRWRVPGAAPLAAWSYSIYLIHKPLSAMAHRQLEGLKLPLVAEPVLITAVSLAGGWLLYRLVERPFLRLRAAWVPAR